MVQFLRYRRFLLVLRQETQVMQERLQAVQRQEEVLSLTVSEQKAQIESAMMLDIVTQLPTRVVLEDRISQAISQSQRYHLTFGMMILELGELKRVNAVLGYQGGDVLLREVAERLRSCVRHVDTVSRYSGNGFAFLLPQLSKAESAAYVAQRLVDAMAQPFMIGEVELFLTGSVGISIYPVDGGNKQNLLRNAETALHQAKLRGCGSFQFYKQEMYVQGRRELLLSSRLRSPDIFHELTIFYQPQISVEERKIVCMEALLRWQHPDYGLIGPREFLTLAENNGTMVAIGEWVLRKSCEQLQSWRREGFDPESISVNVSLRQLDNPQFVHKVSQILHETKTKPSELTIEISESILLPQFDLVEKTLNMLRYLGVRVAVDDFGIGFVSLQHLREFPLNCLKIDGSLVQDSVNKPESVAIIKMIIALANSLALSVVAEGVETEEQKKLMAELGCGRMQGHLFCLPLKPQEFTHPIVENIKQQV